MIEIKLRCGVSTLRLVLIGRKKGWRKRGQQI
jgi:hypothetical protein